MKFLLPSLVAIFSAANLYANAGPGPWANGAYFPGQLDGRYSATVYNDEGEEQSAVFSTNSVIITNSSTITVITNVGGLSVTSSVTTNIITPTLVTNKTVTGSVVSGILGFGIRNGTPSLTAGGASNNQTGGGGSSNSLSSSSALQTFGLDQSHNYFLIYINGDVYVGTTAAQINPDSGKIAGTLVNGYGKVTYQLFTNQTAGVVSVANNSVQVISLPSSTANGYFDAKVKNNKSPYTFKGSGTVSVSSASDSDTSVDGLYEFDLDGIKSSDNSVSAYSSAGRTAP